MTRHLRYKISRIDVNATKRKEHADKCKTEMTESQAINAALKEYPVNNKYRAFCASKGKTYFHKWREGLWDEVREDTGAVRHWVRKGKWLSQIE